MNDGDFKIDVRVVGLYAYFPDQAFPEFTENSTIEEIMNGVAGRVPTFRFGRGARNNQASTPAIGEIEYELTEVPPPFGPIPNASMPTAGPRKLAERLDDDPAAVLQFYREAVISGDGKELRVRNQTIGQPSFSETAIGLDGSGQSLNASLPTGWQIVKYRLIWRLLELDISSETRDQLRMGPLDLVG